NLSKGERTAMNLISSDSSIIIKQADKGGAIVIMDSDYYKQKVEELLLDEEYYREIPENIDPDTMKKIQKLVSKHSMCITPKERNYLLQFEVKESNFYGIPKVHKSKIIQQAVEEQNSDYIETPRPGDLHLRPIVAGPVCPTHRLSHFLDIILKPLSERLPSFLKDDIDFIRHLPNEIDENSIFVTFDVKNMYSNIPHDLGLEAIAFWIHKYRNLIDGRFTSEFILESLEIILKCNSFVFNDTHFIQTVGTAMGTKVAPTYANLVMGFLEEILFEKINEMYQPELAGYIKESWKRFLDDCFSIWKQTKGELVTFHALLNSLHPAIEFTMEIGEKQLPFLDVLVQKNNTLLTTDVFYKSTDTHQYLDFRSSHPSHTKRNIPYCLARRICTIVSDQETRDERLVELNIFLKSQNYPDGLIGNGIRRARQIPRNELLAPKVKQTASEKIPFVTTYIPCHPNMVEVAKTNLPILHQSQKMRELIRPEDILSSKRQPNNLKKILTRARYSVKKKSDFTVSRCGDSRCGTCDYMSEGNQFVLKNGRTIIPNANMNCKSKNLIYCITCAGCSESYIGQTGNALCERTRVHRQQIRCAETRQIPLSGHIDECGRGSFTIYPFNKMTEENCMKRLNKERRLIEIFQPRLNK
ncbi:hypothetical protein, partial [Solemya velum gill symbiont]|uniref:hypothetical protein n=2 Tax=Solemya velum gill symbiont TaxID=2340 RepID=UPI0009D471A5